MVKHVGITFCNNVNDLKKQIINNKNLPYHVDFIDIVKPNLNYEEAIKIKENYKKNGFLESKLPQSVYTYLQTSPDISHLQSKYRPVKTYPVQNTSTIEERRKSTAEEFTKLFKRYNKLVNKSNKKKKWASFFSKFIFMFRLAYDLFKLGQGYIDS